MTNTFRNKSIIFCQCKCVNSKWIVEVLPIYVLCRFQSIQQSTSKGSRGEVQVDTMHPRVFIQLQHLLYNLDTNKGWAAEVAEHFDKGAINSHRSCEDVTLYC